MFKKKSTLRLPLLLLVCPSKNEQYISSPPELANTKKKGYSTTVRRNTDDGDTQRLKNIYIQYTYFVRGRCTKSINRENNRVV